MCVRGSNCVCVYVCVWGRESLIVCVCFCVRECIIVCELHISKKPIFGHSRVFWISHKTLVSVCTVLPLLSPHLFTRSYLYVMWSLLQPTVHRATHPIFNVLLVQDIAAEGTISNPRLLVRQKRWTDRKLCYNCRLCSCLFTERSTNINTVMWFHVKLFKKCMSVGVSVSVSVSVSLSVCQCICQCVSVCQCVCQCVCLCVCQCLLVCLSLWNGEQINPFSYVVAIFRFIGVSRKGR